MTKILTATYVVMAFVLAATAIAQQRFDSPEAAAQAAIDATAKHDGARLGAIFGPQGNAILTSGNRDQDRAEQSEFSKLANDKHQLLPDPRNPNRVILSVGEEDWPFPVPIVRSDGKWSFDSSETPSEMRARHIGMNELDAIEICTGYVEAQQKYASEDHDKDGVLKYASHMMNKPDGRDGLNQLVPQGLIDATWDGQKQASKPYHGYFFRILTGQGPNAPEGSHSYLVKDKLLGGFGLVAWPAQYGVTGIQTFIVNQDGVIYGKDIAPQAGHAPPPITRYDPDSTWTPAN
jgi:hypothetical protein